MLTLVHEGARTVGDDLTIHVRRPPLHGDGIRAVAGALDGQRGLERDLSLAIERRVALGGHAGCTIVAARVRDTREVPPIARQSEFGMARRRIDCGRRNRCAGVPRLARHGRPEQEVTLDGTRHGVAADVVLLVDLDIDLDVGAPKTGHEKRT